MSHSYSPIYVPSRSSSPELIYPSAGHTPFPPSSPTPFAGNAPIPPMDLHIPTPTTPQYVQDYENAANDVMVIHMARMMRMTSEEATVFVAMNQSILEPFLCSVSPPPHPPTPPTPEPLPVPPHYHNLSPEAPDYDLIDPVEFHLPSPTLQPSSPVETHVSYPPSPLYHPKDDLDHFPNSDWLSNLPSLASSPNLNNAPVLQAFIQTMDDPVEN